MCPIVKNFCVLRIFVLAIASLVLKKMAGKICLIRAIALIFGILIQHTTAQTGYS